MEHLPTQTQGGYLRILDTLRLTQYLLFKTASPHAPSSPPPRTTCSARYTTACPWSCPGTWKTSGSTAPSTDPATLVSVLTPYPNDAMEAYEVSILVNSAANDGPEVIEAVA